MHQGHGRYLYPEVTGLTQVRDQGRLEEGAPLFLRQSDSRIRARLATSRAQLVRIQWNERKKATANSCHWAAVELNAWKERERMRQI